LPSGSASVHFSAGWAYQITLPPELDAPAAGQSVAVTLSPITTERTTTAATCLQVIILTLPHEKHLTIHPAFQPAIRDYSLSVGDMQRIRILANASIPAILGGVDFAVLFCNTGDDEETAVSGRVGFAPPRRPTKGRHRYGIIL
jgi:hypothetical protein